jgi:hypothetical protein
MAHRTVRCPTEKETSQSGDSLPRPVFILFIVRCATEQSGAPTNRRQELHTKWSPTAPSCLGAIKGTPRRMEHYTKHPLNILRRLDSATTQLDHRVWDLSTFWVVNSMCRVVCSRLDLCACDCCDSCVCFFPSLTLMLCLVVNLVRVRGSNLWRFLTNGKRL